MSFIGGGAQNFQDFFEFLGTVKDKRVPPAGSPFQIDFPGESKTPKGMAAANETVPPCWDSALRCSCGDCPEGPQCTPVGNTDARNLTGLSPTVLLAGHVLGDR